MMQLEIMAAIANKLQKGAASTIVVNKSADSSMNKGRGENTNPYMGRVIIAKSYSGYVMGTDYLSSIENAAERMGNADAEANLKSVWHKPASEFGEWFSTDKKTESKIYLKLQRNEKQIGCKTITTYYLDGHEATEEEIADIERWMKKKSHTISSTQADMGIDAEHEQHFLLMQLDTIVSIKQGEKELSPVEMLSVAVAAR